MNTPLLYRHVTVATGRRQRVNVVGRLASAAHFNH